MALTATALYDYNWTQEGDLEFKENDVITVTQQGDDGWWCGELNGQSGYFPSNYVELAVEGAPAEGGEETYDQGGRFESFYDDSPAPNTDYDNMYTDDAVDVQAVTATTEEQLAVSDTFAWMEKAPYFTISIEQSDTKKKFGGMKKYVSYQITSSTGASVERRYKHFSWLHARLLDRFPAIPIPPLPEKQVSGRFENDFIEMRRAGLQEFLNILGRHPVLRTSTVFTHFLTCDDGSDNKKWKEGKRAAEKNPHNGKDFYTSIVCGNAVDPMCHDSIDAFKKMLQVQDRYHKDVADVSAAVQVRRKEMSKTMETYGEHICNLGGQKEGGICWSMQCESCDAVGAAFIVVGSAMKEISQRETKQTDEEDRMLTLTRQYRTYMKDFQNHSKLERGARGTFLSAQTKYQKKQPTPAEQTKLAGLQQRSDLMTAGTLAEMEHFHHCRSIDFKRSMRDYVAAQVAFHKEVAQMWETGLSTIDAIPADADAYQM